MTTENGLTESRDILVSTKARYDKVDSIASECKPISSPSTYEGQSVISPSLAEGVRGWVNPTSASQAKSATTNDKNATVGNVNAYITNKANANISVITKETSASPCFLKKLRFACFASELKTSAAIHKSTRHYRHCEQVARLAWQSKIKHDWHKT